LDPSTVLASIPPALRAPLLKAFNEILRNFRERRWEPSELNGGKFSEVVYSILRGHVDGKMPTKTRKPKNMVDSCRALELADPTVFPRSVRIQVPRMLIALYEIRNNRGVGHVGGDVDPNHMDAKVVVEMAKWILAELIRIFHNVTTSEATNLVDALVERTVPAVWEVGTRRRVLTSGLTKKNEALLLLFSSNQPISDRDLCSWVEHSNLTVFRRDVLRVAHKNRLIEYDETSGEVRLSPKGIAYVEDNLLAAST
jgi:hypothetical protein